jgi:phosphonoacetaldehyde hydrolase
MAITGLIRDSDPLAGVIFDWAGTIVDFGSLAPMQAFVDLFASHGVEITVAQARVPMGLPKLAHIQALGAMPDIGHAWLQQRGRKFDVADAHALLAQFEPMSAQAALERSGFVPGFRETLEWLHRHRILVATTTGYTRRILGPVLERARFAGFFPERVVCCDDVAKSRPDPMGVMLCLETMGLSGQAQHCVKVDDTAPGLDEGRNAGCWTVGVAASGNALGWEYTQWLGASAAERAHALLPARAKLLRAGAHEVIVSVADLPDCLIRIARRIRNGETPGQLA